jgi:hypothetical protein
MGKRQDCFFDDGICGYGLRGGAGLPFRTGLFLVFLQRHQFFKTPPAYFASCHHPPKAYHRMAPESGLPKDVYHSADSAAHDEPGYVAGSHQNDMAVRCVRLQRVRTMLHQAILFFSRLGKESMHMLRVVLLALFQLRTISGKCNANRILRLSEMGSHRLACVHLERCGF